MSRWGPKKRGRKPRAEVAATHRISIRLTSDEYWAWKREATGQSLSNFIRRAVNKKVADMNSPRQSAPNGHGRTMTNPMATMTNPMATMTNPMATMTNPMATTATSPQSIEELLVDAVEYTREEFGRDRLRLLAVISAKHGITEHEVDALISEHRYVHTAEDPEDEYIQITAMAHAAGWLPWPPT